MRTIFFHSSLCIVTLWESEGCSLLHTLLQPGIALAPEAEAGWGLDKSERAGPN